MKKRQQTKDTFFMLTPLVRDRLLKIKLTAAEWRIWCYLVSLDPFGDRGARFSSAELMLKCGIKKTTYFSAKNKFQKLGLFDFHDSVTKVVNLQTSTKKSENSNYSQQVELIESEISESQFKNSESRFEISESQFGNSESQSPKPLSDKDCNSPQTVQNIQTIQTATEEEKKEAKESENSSKITSNSDRHKGEEENKFCPSNSSMLATEDETPQPMSSLSNILISTTDIKNGQSNSKPVIQKTEQHEQDNEIPADIKEKLQQLNIPLDERVRSAIAKYHRSQILGAIDHITNTWETINNPLSIFLYQLPKQKVEQLGTRGKVYRAASEGGYCLERIKKMYPHNWREAAKHFGVIVDESLMNDE